MHYLIEELENVAEFHVRHVRRHCTVVVDGNVKAHVGSSTQSCENCEKIGNVVRCKGIEKGSIQSLAVCLLLPKKTHISSKVQYLRCRCLICKTLQSQLSSNLDDLVDENDNLEATYFVFA